MHRFGYGLALWLFGMTTAAAAGAFGPPQRVMLAWSSASDVAIGDVNGDGRADLVVSARNAPHWDYTLRFFLQQPDGTLEAAAQIGLAESDGSSEYRLALADLDGDGALEAVTSAGGQAGVQVVKLTSAGTLSATRHPGPGWGCKYIVAGDIDRDGRPDVVCHDEQLSASVYIGNGRGGFRSSHWFQTLAGWYVLDYDFKTLRLADVTGDGYPDLLIAAGHSRSFHVHANNRMGGFFPAVSYAHPRAPDGGLLPSVDIQVADLDGDGVSEVLTTTPNARPDATLNVYRPGPGGYLVLSERVPVHDYPMAIVTGQIGTGPGLGVVLAHYAVGSVSVLGGDGRGLASQSLHPLPGYGNHIMIGDAGRQYAIALGDLDGDGCQDLAAATYSGVQLLHGCQSGRWRPAKNDFDGDGISDLLWHQRESSELFLWQWASWDYYYSCAALYRGNCPFPLGRRMDAQAVGDFDGDRNADVFWRDPLTGENLLTLGAFDPSALATVTDRHWTVVGAGDFDGDGRSDLLWRNGRTGANTIWRSAAHRTQLPVRAVTDTRWQVAGVGDFDGDGRADIVWRHAASGRNVVWRAGRHDAQIALTAVTNLDWQVRAVGDFNADGLDDIVWRNVRTGANTIWLAGNYRNQRPVTAVTRLEWDIATVGDFNGDGSSDLVWRNARTGANTIWLSGRYQTQQPVEPWPVTFSLVR